MIKSISYRFHPTVLSVTMILLGIIIHWGCYLIWGHSYSGFFYKMAVTVLGISKLVGSPAVELYEWCFKYTGWSLYPLSYLVGYSVYKCYEFVNAHHKNIPLEKAFVKLTNLEYASDVASDVGFAATIFYIIAALGILASTLVGNASENVSKNEMTAKAIMLVATSLGSTFVAIIPIRCHGHAKWLYNKWVGLGGSNE